jgi:hypothetical protein
MSERAAAFLGIFTLVTPVDEPGVKEIERRPAYPNESACVFWVDLPRGLQQRLRLHDIPRAARSIQRRFFSCRPSARSMLRGWAVMAKRF